MIHFAKEFVEAEEEVVLAVEDIPLNNRHSQTAMVSEFSFIRSAATRVRIERETGRKFGVDGRLLAAIKSRTESHLQRTLNLDVHSETRREIKLRLTAAPHAVNHYRVVWKQQGTRGFQEVEVGGKFYQIPFLITHGLSATVETVPVEEQGPT